MSSAIAIQDAEESSLWILLEEIEHRVGNEYAIAIASLHTLGLSCEASAKPVLALAASRLRRQFEAHRALRAPYGSEGVDLSAHLRMVCGALSEGCLAERGITLTLEEDTVVIAGPRAWRIALIVSELIMNAMRHAFPGREEGRIVVAMSVDDRGISCWVADNGSAPIPTSLGRGSRIVDALTRDLGGRIHRQFTMTGATAFLRVPHEVEKTDDVIDAGPWRSPCRSAR